jgi:hypothetical protein
MLLAAEGRFSLGLALCDDRELRNELVRRLRAELPGIVAVELAPQTQDVFQAVQERLAGTRPRALFILDLEASIPADPAAPQPSLRNLNAGRERWPELACPLVFWLATYAAVLLTRQAPDFWRWRSHQFEFVPDQVPVTPPLHRALAEPFPG